MWDCGDSPDRAAPWLRSLSRLPSEQPSERRRRRLTEHRAYLQPTPDGDFLVVVVQEGPGSDSFTESVVSSDHEFDRWFVENVADLHGIDPAGPLPPVPTRYV